MRDDVEADANAESNVHVQEDDAQRGDQKLKLAASTKLNVRNKSKKKEKKCSKKRIIF